MTGKNTYSQWPDEKDDQKRIMTPGEAVSLGADYVVVGRQIIKSEKPLNQLMQINTEIEQYQN